jgi:hypothetical protein
MAERQALAKNWEYCFENSREVLNSLTLTLRMFWRHRKIRLFQLSYAGFPAVECALAMVDSIEPYIPSIGPKGINATKQRKSRVVLHKLLACALPYYAAAARRLTA